MGINCLNSSSHDDAHENNGLAERGFCLHTLLTKPTSYFPFDMQRCSCYNGLIYSQHHASTLPQGFDTGTLQTHLCGPMVLVVINLLLKQFGSEKVFLSLDFRGGGYET